MRDEAMYMSYWIKHYAEHEGRGFPGGSEMDPLILSSVMADKISRAVCAACMREIRRDKNTTAGPICDHARLPTPFSALSAESAENDPFGRLYVESGGHCSSTCHTQTQLPTTVFGLRERRAPKCHGRKLSPKSMILSPCDALGRCEVATADLPRMKL